VTHASQAINKTYKTEDSHGPAITTVAASFGHNIPSVHLRDHLLRRSTCSQQQNLHGCGGCRIRTGGIMSPLSQYKTYRDLSDIKLTKFSQ
jgi:hypothetical protein